jgi:YbbR domain-containing protein
MVFENGSYKLVAFFVTLILWVTILGRRDVALRKDIDLEFLVPRNMVIQEPVERKVTVKVSGPHMALKKFQANPGTITIDLTHAQVGPNRAAIGPHSVEVPFGVKVDSVTPEALTITLAPATPP